MLSHDRCDFIPLQRVACSDGIPLIKSARLHIRWKKNFIHPPSRWCSTLQATRLIWSSTSFMNYSIPRIGKSGTVKFLLQLFLTHAEFRTLHIDAIISHHGVQAHGKHHSGSQGTVRSDELLLSRLRAVLQVEVYAGCVTCAL